MDTNSYKIYHEEHMKFNNGTSIEENALIVSLIPFCVFFSILISPLVLKNLQLLLEFFILILPMILSVTVLSQSVHLMFFGMFFLYLVIILSISNFKTISKVLNYKFIGSRNFITNYRASTNYVSAICILSVDFNIFPKRFAKTESYGLGLMDLGVGFFVCANGLVLKHKIQTTQQFNEFIKVLLSTSIFLILGIVRLISIKGLNYHEHVTEYGVHWNFFFTLALIKILVFMIKIITKCENFFFLALLTGLMHEINLNLGLKDWVFSNEPRITFISANREGFTSSLGYLCLYFAACSLQKFFFDSVNFTYKNILIKLGVLTVFFWLMTLICLNTIGVSRRITNIGYIFWVLSSTTTALFLFIANEISIMAIKKSQAKWKFKFDIPCLIQSINANGMPFFLMSNLLTGLINFLFQTLVLNSVFSLLIISSYMAILCSVSNYLFVKQILLKNFLNHIFFKGKVM